MQSSLDHVEQLLGEQTLTRQVSASGSLRGAHGFRGPRLQPSPRLRCHSRLTGEPPSYSCTTTRNRQLPRDNGARLQMLSIAARIVAPDRLQEGGLSCRRDSRAKTGRSRAPAPGRDRRRRTTASEPAGLNDCCHPPNLKVQRALRDPRGAAGSLPAERPVRSGNGRSRIRP